MDEGLIATSLFAARQHRKPFKIIDTDNFETMSVQYNLLNREHEAAILPRPQQGDGRSPSWGNGGGRLIRPGQDVGKMQPSGR